MVKRCLGTQNRAMLERRLEHNAVNRAVDRADLYFYTAHGQDTWAGPAQAAAKLPVKYGPAKQGRQQGAAASAHLMPMLPMLPMGPICPCCPCCPCCCRRTCSMWHSPVCRTRRCKASRRSAAAATWAGPCQQQDWALPISPLQ
jgi:hypothetical protein